LTTVLGGGFAAGQTGYPPTTTTPVLCTGGNASAGTVAVGTTITFTLCGPFKPGTTVTVTVNGGAPSTKTANANGSVTVVLTVTSTSSGLVNDPVKVDINCGANNVVATGTSPTGAAATSTGTFTVNCAPATSPGGLAFTGANIFKFLAAALLLIAIGAALVLAQRRRRSHAA
jgi:hypothetical protein